MVTDFSPLTPSVFGLVGVFAGASIVWFKEWSVARRTKKEKASYLAARVVCILDEYVSGCIDAIGDDGLCCGQPNKNGYHEVQVSPPPTPKYPDDIDWQSINPALMYDILSFPNSIEAAKEAIRATDDFAFPPTYDEFFEERQHQYSLLGLKALDIADCLRNQFNFPSRRFEGWHTPPEKIFQKKLDQIKKLKDMMQ